MSDRTMQHIDVAHAALMEAGRPDLAESIIGRDDDDGFGFFLEVNDDIMTDDEWALINKAENMARQFIGQSPLEREP
jgi:hypothetical protein